MALEPRVFFAIVGLLAGMGLVGLEFLISQFYAPEFSFSQWHSQQPALFLIESTPLIFAGIGWYLGSSVKRIGNLDARYRDILRAINDVPLSFMICDARPPHDVLFVNNAFEELTGYSPKEVIGRPCDYLQGDAGELNRSAFEQLNHAIIEQSSVTVVLKNSRRNGETFFNRLQVFPIEVGNPSRSLLVGIQTDVTEAEQLGINQRAYQRELERWRRVFLATDTRILALKVEVNHLRGRLGMDEKYRGCTYLDGASSPASGGDARR